MRAGDEYVVEWHDGDRQRYRVEGVDGDKITFRRWVATKSRWTPWTGVHRHSAVAPLMVEGSRGSVQRR